MGTIVYGTPAAGGSYATLAELKLYLGIDTDETADDTLLTALLARAQVAIESDRGRRYAAVTTTRYYEASALRGGLLLLDDDLLTVTTLTNGDLAGTVIAAANYILWPRNAGRYWGIRLKQSYSPGWVVDTDCAIALAGTWGWSATAPVDIVQATIRWAAYFYRQKDAQVFDTTSDPATGQLIIPKGVPADVRLLLDNYPKREVF